MTDLLLASFLDGHSDLVTVLLAIVAIVLLIVVAKIFFVILSKL